MNIQEKNNITIQIGKNGISENTITDIKKNLSKNKLVKVKILKNILENEKKEQITKEIIQKIENIKTESKIVGNTLFLKRKK